MKDVTQPDPAAAVTAGQLVISGITVPANGSAVIVTLGIGALGRVASRNDTGGEDNCKKLFHKRTTFIINILFKTAANIAKFLQ